MAQVGQEPQITINPPPTEPKDPGAGKKDNKPKTAAVSATGLPVQPPLTEAQYTPAWLLALKNGSDDQKNEYKRIVEEQPHLSERALRGETEDKEEQYLYRERLNQAERSPAGNTEAALDRSLMNVSRLYLQDGEVRRMSWLRSSFPFLAGIGAGLAPLSDVFSKIGIAGGITAIFSPAISMIRRATGENAYSQFARFANRREDRGIMSRLLHGGESRVLKTIFLREDRNVRQLLRLFDQKVDLNMVNLGSRERINDLIAAGYEAEMKAQMIAEHDMQLSKKEQDKVKRFHDAYTMAKSVFNTKIPTPGQRQIFVNDILPDLIRGREQRLWLQQTAGITGVGILKAIPMAIAGDLLVGGFAGNILGGAADLARNIIGGIPQTVYNLKTWAAFALHQPYPAITAAEAAAGVKMPVEFGLEAAGLTPMSVADALKAVK